MSWNAITMAAIALAAAPAAADPEPVCKEHPTTIVGHVEDSIDHHDRKPAEHGFYKSSHDSEVRIQTDKHGRFVLHFTRTELAKFLKRLELTNGVYAMPKMCEGWKWFETSEYAWPHGASERYQTVFIDTLK